MNFFSPNLKVNTFLKTDSAEHAEILKILHKIMITGVGPIDNGQISDLG